MMNVDNIMDYYINVQSFIMEKQKSSLMVKWKVLIIKNQRKFKTVLENSWEKLSSIIIQRSYN